MRLSSRPKGVLHLALFGSTARNEAGSESDIDLMAVFDDTRKIRLFDVFDIEHQLADILGRRVEITNRVKMKPLIQEGA